MKWYKLESFFYFLTGCMNGACGIMMLLSTPPLLQDSNIIIVTLVPILSIIVAIFMFIESYKYFTYKG